MNKDTTSNSSQENNTNKQPVKFKDIDLYKTVEPIARNIKIIFQMFIGLSIGIYMLFIIGNYIYVHVPINTLARQTLEFIGGALIVSTGFELAYTLFTEGPDEAVEPLITGLAAVILVIIAPLTSITANVAGGISLLVFALILLFILRHFFTEGKGWNTLISGWKTPQQNHANESKDKPEQGN